MPASFAGFGLPPRLLSALAAAGIDQPFPIQSATLPDALAGRDILGRAKTGSGKTLGFSIPLVVRLAKMKQRTRPGRPRGLVLVPTRELATQVQRVLSPLAEAMGLSATIVFGGTSMRPQVAALRQGTDIVVACPGRLADLIDRGHCDLGDVAVTVLDEADHMADLGFLPVVRRLLASTPADGQRLLFSATLDSAIDVLVRRFLTDPARHSVGETAPPAEMTHHLLTVTPADRVEVLIRLVGGDNRSLIFTRTKHGAKRLARQLTTAGIPAAQLHGDLAQNARERNLASFSSGQIRVLVATDIAARGIHVDGVDLVIHADPPAEHKAYLHRSGRTARGGAGGTVVTIQLAAQSAEVRRLMRNANVTPHSATVTPESRALDDIAGGMLPRVIPAPEERADRPARRPRPADGDRRDRPARQPRQERGRRAEPGKPRAERAQGNPGKGNAEPAGQPERVGGAERKPRKPRTGEHAKTRTPRAGERGHGGSGGRSRRAPGDAGGRPRRTEIRGRGA
jgi:superfamily II DNA/RNA helicase